MSTPDSRGPRERAVQMDLDRFVTLDGVRTLAQNALQIARTLDDGCGPGEEARLSLELRQTMRLLIELAPAPAAPVPSEPERVEPVDVIDELRQRRENRDAAR